MANCSIGGEAVQYIAPGGAGRGVPRERGVPAEAPGSARGKSPLGINTKFASGRVKRFALQSIARELMPKERVGFCLRGLKQNPEEPARARVIYSPKAKKAHYGGLMVCGSVWMCPVCASKVTERRRLELAGAVSLWEGSVFMATFTLQHSREDKLEELRDYLKSAYRAIKSGRWWVDFEKRYGVVGSIAGTEITVSLANGWHPHLHVLFFSRVKNTELDREAVESDLLGRFKAVLAKKGRYVSAIYGVRVDQALDAQSDGDQALKSYASKWGLEDELTKSPVKSARSENGVEHYSPFQLLELYLSGQKWAGAWFRDYATAMKGSKQLVWSKGLRAVLGLQTEKSDQELAEDLVEIGDQLLASLTWAQWKRVLASDARAELLEVADAGDQDRVKEFLRSLGVYYHGDT